MSYLGHVGSVKDFYVTKDPTDDKFGTGYLYCKQRQDGTGPLSIFDLKERFPFGIRGKDQAIHDEGVSFFKLMKNAEMIDECGDGLDTLL